MDSYQVTEKEIKLIRILVQCEYPAAWVPRYELETVPDEMVRRLTEQLDEKTYDVDFQFEELMLYVGLAYEYAIENKLEEGLKILDKGLKIFEEIKNRDEAPASSLQKALLHIMMSTKADLLLRSKDLSALEVSAGIPPLKDMNVCNRAAIHGLRAVFFSEYGIYGSKLALKFSSKAIELDPDESLWHFLKGKFLGRIRHVERPFDVPQREEIQLLEVATNLKKRCPSYLVFTAQLYRETANRIFRALKTNNSLYPDRQIVLDKLNEKSVEFYNQSIELKPECAHMLFRCAKGFITFPFPYRDEKRAKQYLDKALEKAPYSGYGNHVMAQYYERIKKEPYKAMKHLKICEEKKVFGAIMDLLRIQHRIEGIDVSEKMKDLLNVYPEKSRKCQLYSQLISHHLFANDLPKACAYASEIIRLKADCIDMLQHRPISVNVFETMNLYDVLIDEIKIQLQDLKCSKENKEVFEKLLKDLSWAGIPVSLTKPTNLKDEIVNTRTRPNTSKPRIKNSTNRGFQKKNDTTRYQQYQPMRTRSLHQTDTDQKMSEIFNKCRQDLENKKKENPSNQSGSSSYDRSKPLQENFREQTITSKDEDEKHQTVSKIESGSLELKNTNAPTSVNDDSNEDSEDDTAFRMKIYAKTQETLKEMSSNQNNSASNQFDDVTISIQKLKLRNDSPQVDQDGYQRPFHNSMNSKTKYQSNKGHPDEVSCDQNENYNPKGNKSNYFNKNERHPYASTENEEKYTTKKRGSGKFDTNELEQRSGNRSHYHEKRKSKSPSRRDAKDRYTEDDTSEHETYYSKRDKHDLEKYKSKHSYNRGNSRTYSDDELGYEAKYLKESKHRSSNHTERQSKHYTNRRRSTESESDSDPKARRYMKDDDASRNPKPKSTRRNRSSSRSPDRFYSRKHEKESRSEKYDHLKTLANKLSKKFEPKNLLF